MAKKNIQAKQGARKLAVQALYQWAMTQQPIEIIEAQFCSKTVGGKIDEDYFLEIFRGVLSQLTEIEHQLVPFLDRPIQQLNPVELSVLRVGGYELLFAPQVPYRVVLDEAINLAKIFGSQDGHRYVNGVLNHMAKKCRSIECSSHASTK